MTKTRRTPPSQNRSTPPKGEEPVSITKPIPGSQSYVDEPKMNLERLGDMLRRVREQRGDDLQYIADYLCIRGNFLVALENSHYDKLPADAYVIGFLRSYANYLGIDGKEAIDRYRNEMAGRRKKPSLVLPTPITEGRTPSAMIMAGAALAALLIYVVWYSLSSSDRTTVSTPPALPSQTVAETNTVAPTAILAPPPSDSGIMLSSAAPAATLTPAAPAPVATPEPAPVPTAAKSAGPTTTDVPGGQALNGTVKDSHLTIRATQSSWVLITDNHGQTIYDHVMKPGDTFQVPSKANLSLTTGNGSGIILTLDGTDLPRLATGNSHVMRNVPLDSDHLRSLPPNPDD